jgi:hypothetical protein
MISAKIVLFQKKYGRPLSVASKLRAGNDTDIAGTVVYGANSAIKASTTLSMHVVHTQPAPARAYLWCTDGAFGDVVGDHGDRRRRDEQGRALSLGRSGLADATGEIPGSDPVAAPLRAGHDRLHAIPRQPRKASRESTTLRPAIARDDRRNRSARRSDERHRGGRDPRSRRHDQGLLRRRRVARHRQGPAVSRRPRQELREQRDAAHVESERA